MPQQYGSPTQRGGPNPVLYGGIFVMIAGYIGEIVLGWKGVGWIKAMGIVLILVGAMLSIFQER